MKNSEQVIAGLMKLKDLTNEVHDRLHDQEHLWEACEYPKLEHKWDKANRDIWDGVHHKFLRRIFALGGRPNGVTEDPATAYTRAIQGFEAIHQECAKLYKVAETEPSDYVTVKLLMSVQKDVEKWLAYLKAKRAQVLAFKPEGFLPEQM